MKKVLIIAFSDLKNDARVFRQIDYLKDHYSVSTIGLKSTELKGVKHYSIRSVKRDTLRRIVRAFEYKLHRFEKIYWSLFDFQPLLDELVHEKFDLILANDAETLPFALKLSKGAKILLDLHEYAPRHFEDQFTWRFFFMAYNQYLCKKYLNKGNAFLTVSSGLANEYKKNFGIEPVVITNASNYVEMKPTPVDKDHIKIITHGVANPNRRLELMMQIMDYTDKRFHLDLMLMPVHPRYYKKLQTEASKRSNVRIIPPVPHEKIISSTNGYDLSFLIFKPYTINYKYGLPNKLFQSLQSRLGLVTGVSPEPQAEIVNEFGCGIVVNSFEPVQIAKQLNQLTADRITDFKNKADAAARVLTSEKNMQLLHQIVEKTINS